ncbi:MAG: NAD(P)/FAD-dependent oxidoreductase [Actinomycetota bacterium]|nr:NAD(P)/FAD-dependent oxidoreductase [Actinomycetota bacterium]
MVGIGAVPNTFLAESAGLKTDNGVVVDAALRTSAPETSSRRVTSRTPTFHCLPDTCASSTGTTPSNRARSRPGTCWART